MHAPKRPRTAEGGSGTPRLVSIVAGENFAVLPVGHAAHGSLNARLGKDFTTTPFSAEPSDAAAAAYDARRAATPYNHDAAIELYNTGHPPRIALALKACMPHGTQANRPLPLLDERRHRTTQGGVVKPALELEIRCLGVISRAAPEDGSGPRAVNSGGATAGHPEWNDSLASYAEQAISLMDKIDPGAAHGLRGDAAQHGWFESRRDTKRALAHYHAAAMHGNMRAVVSAAVLQGAHPHVSPNVGQPCRFAVLAAADRATGPGEAAYHAATQAGSLAQRAYYAFKADRATPAEIPEEAARNNDAILHEIVKKVADRTDANIAANPGRADNYNLLQYVFESFHKCAADAAAAAADKHATAAATLADMFAHRDDAPPSHLAGDLVVQEAGGEGHRVHAAVLATASVYFRTALANARPGDDHGTLVVAPDTRLAQIIGAMYAPDDQLTRGSPDETLALLERLHYYVCPALIEVVADHLEPRISASNACRALAVGSSTGRSVAIRQLHFKARRIIRQNFAAAATRPFVLLTYTADDLQHLVRETSAALANGGRFDHADLKRLVPQQIEAVIAWWKASPTDRLPDLDKLLREIDLEHLAEAGASWAHQRLKDAPAIQARFARAYLNRTRPVTARVYKPKALVDGAAEN